MPYEDLTLFDPPITKIFLLAHNLGWATNGGDKLSFLKNKSFHTERKFNLILSSLHSRIACSITDFASKDSRMLHKISEIKERRSSTL